MHQTFKLMLIKNLRRKILRWCFSSSNVLIWWIFKRLRMKPRQRRRGTLLRNVMLMRTISKKFWENNLICCRYTTMRRSLNILTCCGTKSLQSPIKWRVVVKLFLTKPSWTRWYALSPPNDLCVMRLENRSVLCKHMNMGCSKEPRYKWHNRLYKFILV